MKNLKLAWLLFRLVRRMERDSAGKPVGASFTVVVEGGEGWEQRARSRPLGAPELERRRGYEVNYWPDVTQGSTVRRGETMAQALATVLSDR